MCTLFPLIVPVEVLEIGIGIGIGVGVLLACVLLGAVGILVGVTIRIIHLRHLQAKDKEINTEMKKGINSYYGLKQGGASLITSFYITLYYHGNGSISTMHNNIQKWHSVTSCHFINPAVL